MASQRSMQRFLTACIRLYQLSRQGRPSPCRFIPSCSVYATECLERHGAIKGSWFALRRVGRCNPFGGSGIDPAPD